MELFVFDSDLGFMGFTRSAGKVLRLAFGHPSRAAVLRSLRKSFTPAGGADASSRPELFDESSDDSSDFEADLLVRRLRQFAAGEPTSFAEVDISLEHLTAFGKRVVQTCRQISWGETITYGELARRVGHPGAARAVGSVMANNRVPLIVPCHRVVPSSGGLGGFSAPQGIKMKRRLLDMEHAGIVCS